MKREKKHTALKVFSFLLIALVTAVFSLLLSFFFMAKDATLSVEALEKNSAAAISLFDKSNNPVDTSSLFSCLPVELDQISPYVLNGFVATEDRRFYSHHGVDYKRIAGAMLHNIKNGHLTEGGSTITQQLIKNTHLSQDRTLERKVKEIKLAYELEKKFTKDQILNMYVNTIYFGNGCYGIEKAAKFYFDKSAKDLSLLESAYLVGAVNAPSVYNPLGNGQMADRRKNIVLKSMLRSGYITEDEYSKNANLTTKDLKMASKQSNIANKYILTEAAKILNVTENQLKNMGVKIFVSASSSFQNEAERILSSGLVPSAGEQKFPASLMVIDNHTRGIVAAASRGENPFYTQMQPGSTIKPLLVYAPAFEKNVLYPDSILVDEPINIDGYSPSNANHAFGGEVTVRQAVEKSLNVPAVKTLSNVSIDYAKSFAERMGITFDKTDSHLALALGAMAHGVTLKQLADAYCCLANNGSFAPSSIIEKITDKNGDVLYEDHVAERQVMRPSTAYLMTDVLKGVSKMGTAKRLSSLKMNVAAKTGTVGIKGRHENQHALAVCYTRDYTLACSISCLDEEKLPSSVNGATNPTEILKNMLEVLYPDGNEQDFEKPSSVDYFNIDLRSLADKRVELAGAAVEPRYKKLVLLPKDNLPPVNKNQLPATTLYCTMPEGQKPTLMFDAAAYISYDIIRQDILTGEQCSILNVKEKEGKISFTDDSALSGRLYDYHLELAADGESRQSNHIKLMAY